MEYNSHGLTYASIWVSNNGELLLPGPTVQNCKTITIKNNHFFVEINFLSKCICVNFWQTSSFLTLSNALYSVVPYSQF